LNTQEKRFEIFQPPAQTGGFKTKAPPPAEAFSPKQQNMPQNQAEELHNNQAAVRVKQTDIRTIRQLRDTKGWQRTVRMDKNARFGRLLRMKCLLFTATLRDE
jgi:hypothetical protein